MMDGSLLSEISELLRLSHFATVMVVTSTVPNTLTVHTQTNPTEITRTTLTPHMLTSLRMLNHQTTNRTSPVLRSRVNLQLFAITQIVQLECSVPR